MSQEYFGAVGKTYNYYDGIRGYLVVPDHVYVKPGTWDYLNFYLGLDTNVGGACYDCIELALSYGPKGGSNEWRYHANWNTQQVGSSSDGKVISAPSGGDWILFEILRNNNGSVTVRFDGVEFGTYDIGLPDGCGIKAVHACESDGNDIEWTQADFRSLQFRYSGESYWYDWENYNWTKNDTGISVYSFLPLETLCDLK